VFYFIEIVKVRVNILVLPAKKETNNIELEDKDIFAIQICYSKDTVNVLYTKLLY
jgi:hypothetical protein